MKNSNTIETKSLYLKKNTIILCPNCNIAVCQTVVDLYLGDFVSEEMFVGLSQKIKNGDLFICEKCGVDYFQDGWFKKVKEH